MAETAHIAELQPPLGLSVDQAARALSVSPTTLRRLIWRGELPARRVGRRVIVSSAALAAFMEGDGAANYAVSALKRHAHSRRPAAS